MHGLADLFTQMQDRDSLPRCLPRLEPEVFTSVPLENALI